MHEDSVIPQSQVHLIIVIPLVLLAVFFAFGYTPESLREEPEIRTVPAAFGKDRFVKMRERAWSEAELEAVEESQDMCLGCHEAGSEMEKEFACGTNVVIECDAEALRASPHGKTLKCLDCHVGYEVDEEEGEHKYFEGSFDAFKEKTRKTCDQCHATNYADLEASAHGSKGGLSCVKCHGFHTIKGTEFNPAKLETSCGQSGCHKELVDGYKDNVHAAGYEKGNKFAPTCMHCHGSTHRLRAVDSPSQAKPELTWGTWFNRSQCYRCHSILGKEFETSHEFLYPAELHLGPKLGCACHTEKTGGLHSLGANNQPVSGKAKEEICSLCHTPKGTLLPAVKDSYVIGATRNKWFDYIGIAIVALTFVGMVLGHGGLRFLTGMLRKAKG